MCFFLTTAGVDYISVALQLSFLPGEVRKDVDLNITDDLLPEGNETFRLVLSVVSNDTVILKTTASNVTITDDDRKQIYYVNGGVAPTTYRTNEVNTFMHDVSMM